MFREECYFCGCSDCSNDGHGGRFSYSKNEYCPVYNCHKRLNCFEKKYCSDHTKKCPNSNCQREMSIFDEYCSNHGKKCQLEYCKNTIANSSYYPYCSQCRDRERKDCKQTGCSKKIAIINEHCSLHVRHSCGFNNCSREVVGQENHYCFYHTNSCRENGCSIRTSSGENYCLEHRYNCSENNCPTRISRGNNYCPQHIHNAFYKERNEKSNLQTQLNNVNNTITNTQNRLRVNNLHNLPQVPQGETIDALIQRPTQAQFDQVQEEWDDYRNKWDGAKEELEQKEETIRRLTREVNAEREENAAHGEMLERRHWEQRVEDIGKFLKFQTKQKELKELKNSAKVKLENGIQKSLIANLLTFQEQVIRLSKDANSRFFSSSEKQLKKVKNSLREKLTEEEINNLCQLQEEIIKLEIELEKSQEQFKAQVQQGIQT